ncbi:MAG: hypothetical protein WDN00_19135 [Limisphaerales bacterium]
MLTRVWPPRLPHAGKTLVLGLIIVSSFIATVFVVKAAMITSDLLFWLDLAYKTSSF